MPQEEKTVDHLGERETRIAKVKKLKEIGVIPYAQSFSKTHSIQTILDTGDKACHGQSTGGLKSAEELTESGAKQKFSTAGRMMSRRTHGKLSFAKIRDDGADIQLCFIRDKCKLHTGSRVVEHLLFEEQEMTAYKFMDKFVDVGDFMGVKGELFVTQHGELTLFVDEFQMLAKAIRPLPEKFHGIQDQEDIYRKRYLDLVMNPDSYKRFQFKSDFYRVLRDFYTAEGFVEVQTNILGNSASGAAAKPFITHHNDYDTDVYLRIAFETGLKKATVGRYEKVFEIGQDFRNEGSDPSHLQEFTQVEHYAVYRNYEDNMKFTEKMMDYVFDTMKIPRKLKVKDKDGLEKQVNFKTPFERIDYVKGVNKASGLDITKYGMNDAKKLIKDLKAKKIEFEGMDTMGTTTLIDYLYKKVLRPKIIGPAFIYNYPVIMQPLARTSDKDPGIVEQFQLIVNGREMCKAYSELVDPLEQQENFDKQEEASAKGDEEATASDDEFVTAMEYGMPPQSGFGMGLERILSILTQQDNLRDVVMFPLMKPEASASVETKDLSSKKTKEVALSDYGTLPTIKEVDKLVDKYLTDTKQHCHDVAQVMKFFANKLGQDENLRYITGLLHDIDRDHINKDGALHLGDEFGKIMDEINASELLVADIRSHGPEVTGIEPDSLIRKYLISVDELAAFIKTVAIMRPTGLEGMKARSVNKKLKDKKFAAGIDRAHVKNCETYLNKELNEFIEEVIEALQS